MGLPEPYPNDFCCRGTSPDPDHPPTEWEEVAPERWERTDEWGNLWRRVEDHSKGEVAKGAVEDWEQLDDLELPDYDIAERYEGARKAFAEHPDKFKIAALGGFPFSIARKMRRLDQFLMDVLTEQERTRELLGRVEQELHHAIERFAEVGANAIMIWEDWGTQAQLLVRLETWRELFKPGFDRLCRTAHENDMYVFMHSCGKISEAMDDMVEAGIDLFQFDQPTLHGIDWLADHFDQRASFWCPVDIQRTLQTEDPEAIEGEAREMVEKLGRNGGGFVAGRYPDDESIGLDPSVQDIACDAFVKYGAPELWEEIHDSGSRGKCDDTNTAK